RAKGLKTDSARVTADRPFLARQFRRLQPFALNDRHLPPRAVEPDVPGNMAGRAPHAAVFLDGVKAVVERIIDLALDEAAADPKPARSLRERFGVNAPGNLLRFKALLPGQPGVGNDELLFHHQP